MLTKLHDFGVLLEVSKPQDTLDYNLLDLLYQNKLLVIRGLKALSPAELWTFHHNFGKPWSNVDYERTLKERSLAKDPNIFVPEFSTYSTNAQVQTSNFPWHRDVPWHSEVSFPIRSLYSHDDYHTPTWFADYDILLSNPYTNELLNSLSLELQFWYDRQFDSPSEIHRLKTKFVPAVFKHRSTGRLTANLNSFSLRPSKPQYKARPVFSSSFSGGWILGAELNGVRLSDVDYLELMSSLHTTACSKDRCLEWRYKKFDLVIFDNMSGLTHSRPSLSPLDTVRSFSRINVRHSWQTSEVKDYLPYGWNYRD